ncbi:MAG: hypothetical protein RID09_07725 [Coleofasciculus sp. G1-WW12-02]|uniref:hypothetical protein n=1 Tax=Coleofasciculus sp. G1-WW12-02 TaxID=3068483 RepID=UPI0032F0A382
MAQIQKFVKDKSFKPYQIKKTVEGATYQFVIGDLEGQEWYFSSPQEKECQLNQEMKFLKEKIVKPGDIILECGTHHGWTTLLLSKWVGQIGQVIGFELNPKNAEIAQENMKINAIDNVTI